MRRLVLDLADERPLFRMPEWVPERIRAALGRGWEVVRVEAPASGLADGATMPSEAALSAVADAEVYIGFGLPAELLRVGRRLAWAHTGTAGVRSAITPELLASGVVLTNSAGVHAPAVAETAVAMMLYFARGLDIAQQAQRRHEWYKAPFDRADTVAREFAGSIVGVLGYGGIGRAVGRRASALGAEVVGVRSDGADLDRALTESDYLVLSAPDTERTRGLIGRDALRRMKSEAVLVNVARGSLVDEAALLDALRSGRLRGAALDVFEREPLPREHPFWDMPNVLILPHVSSYSARFWERETELVQDNIRRYLAGETLRNVVDPRAGY